MLHARKTFPSSFSACFHLFCLSHVILVSSGGTILTQSPASLAASQGKRVTIPLETSSSISSSNLKGYQQKPAASPKLLVYFSASLASGVLAHLSRHGYGWELLTVSPPVAWGSNVQPITVASSNFWLATVLKTATKAPAVGPAMLPQIP